MSSTYAEPLAALARGLEDLAAIDPVYRTTGEQQDVLVGLSRFLARAEAERMRVLVAADDVAVETGARSAAHWLADATRDNIGPVRRLSVLAEALDERWTEVGAALASGAVNVPQASVIVEALDALPASLDADMRVKAQAHLIAEAGHFGPRELRRLGRGLLEVVAPEIADEAEYQRLLAEEKRSQAETRLNIRDRGDGTSDLTGRIPTTDAHRLRTYLDAYTSPRRHPPGSLSGDVDRLPMPRRRGEAFCALLENLPVSGLPKHGGTATSVMVILDLDTLKADCGWAETSTGDRMTAEQARRLACQAGIIPVVLGAKGEVLDLGRTRRLFSPAQRKAMALRDRGCTADGCSIPAAWCEAHHHRQPWSQGGRTDLADGKLLCPFHHHRAHDPGWITSHHPNGSTSFHRRT
jgi:hypothetical protein